MVRRQRKRNGEGAEPTVNENEKKTHVMLYDTMKLRNLNEEVGNSCVCVVMRRNSKSHRKTANKGKKDKSY